MVTITMTRAIVIQMVDWVIYVYENDNHKDRSFSTFYDSMAWDRKLQTKNSM